MMSFPKLFSPSPVQPCQVTPAPHQCLRPDANVRQFGLLHSAGRIILYHGTNRSMCCGPIEE